MRLALSLSLACAACARPPAAAPTPVPLAEPEVVVEPELPAEPAPAVAPVDVAQLRRDAEDLWAQAERDGDHEAWVAAAIALGAVADAADEPERRGAVVRATEAWQHAAGVVRADRTPTRTRDWARDPEPEPIPELEQQMIAAFERHAGYLASGDDDRVRLVFLIGRVHWRFHHLEVAVPYFAEVVDTRPDHDVAEYAANLLLDALNRLRRYDELVARIRSMLGDKVLLAGRPELAGRLGMLRRQADRKDAERHEQRGDHRACAAAYLALHHEDPKADDDADLLYNAAVCYELAGERSRAIETYDLLLRRHPKSELATPARQRRDALSP
jgi:tetratricopeptide (TPR) repeat protein